ncbi:MAG: transcriptional regulator [Chloroflexota bacterium]
MILGSDTAYTDLLLRFPPRLITTEAEYEAALDEIGGLLAKEPLSEAEREFLALLSALIQSYEEEKYPVEEFGLRGVPLINGLMELHELTVANLLPVFETVEAATAVLEQKSSLTVVQINRLASFFNLSHDLFFEPIESY